MTPPPPMRRASKSGGKLACAPTIYRTEELQDSNGSFFTAYVLRCPQAQSQSEPQAYVSVYRRYRSFKALRRALPIVFPFPPGWKSCKTPEQILRRIERLQFFLHQILSQQEGKVVVRRPVAKYEVEQLARCGQ